MDLPNPPKSTQIHPNPLKVDLSGFGWVWQIHRNPPKSTLNQPFIDFYFLVSPKPFSNEFLKISICFPIVIVFKFPFSPLPHLSLYISCPLFLYLYFSLAIHFSSPLFLFCIGIGYKRYRPLAVLTAHVSST